MNYHDLLNIKYSIKYYFLLLILLFILLFIFISNKKIMDVYQTIGYVKDNNILINIPISNTMLSNLDNVTIENNKYYKNDLVVSDILLDEINVINYQEIEISLNNDIDDNLVVPVTIYYNEEKVLTKIKKLLF